MYFKNKNFLVCGLEKSGMAMSEVLISKGANVYLFDESKSDRIKNNIKKLVEKGAINRCSLEVPDALNNMYAVVLSPAIPIDSEIVTIALNKRIRILGEIELGFLINKEPIVAITGTNGKTTTTTMINEILNGGNIKSVAVGNIGVPYCSAFDEQYDVKVVETSSYQLETIRSFNPHIACFLNITPDHIKRHGSFGNYLAAKKRIFKNQMESEYAVVNFDMDEREQITEKIKSKIYYFSRKQVVKGAYLENDDIFFKDEITEFIMKKNELKLLGEHNIENVLCAIVVAKLLDIKSEDIRKVLSEFKGVANRLENVAQINNVNYFNDSKSTNVDSTIIASRAMDRPTILILGGSDKGFGFDELFENLGKNIVHIILTGETRFKLLESATKSKYEKITVCSKFDDAVHTAISLAKSGYNVLLSPACASFDEFANFEERGARFKELVQNR